MTRKTVLSIAFLSITAAAVGMEVWFATDHDADTRPWTDYIASWIPAPITFAAIAVLLSWLSPHFIEAYARKGKKTMDTTTIPATPEPGAPSEPLLSVGTVTAFAAAALGLLAAFGLPLTDAQTGGILGLIAVGAPVVVAVWARKKVFSPATTRAMVITAAKTGQVPTEPVTVPAEKTP